MQIYCIYSPRLHSSDYIYIIVRHSEIAANAFKPKGFVTLTSTDSYSLSSECLQPQLEYKH